MPTYQARSPDVWSKVIICHVSHQVRNEPGPRRKQSNPVRERTWRDRVLSVCKWPFRAINKT